MTNQEIIGFLQEPQNTALLEAAKRYPALRDLIENKEQTAAYTRYALLDFQDIVRSYKCVLTNEQSYLLRVRIDTLYTMRGCAEEEKIREKAAITNIESQQESQSDIKKCLEGIILIQKHLGIYVEPDAEQDKTDEK